MPANVQGLRAWWNSTPRWVKAFLIVVIASVSLFVVIVLLGGHTPPQHGP